MTQDRYAKLRSIDKRIAGLAMAEAEAHAAVTARFKVKQQTLEAERKVALAEIGATEGSNG